MGLETGSRSLWRVGVFVGRGMESEKGRGVRKRSWVGEMRVRANAFPYHRLSDILPLRVLVLEKQMNKDVFMFSERLHPVIKC